MKVEDIQVGGRYLVYTLSRGPIPATILRIERPRPAQTVIVARSGVTGREITLPTPRRIIRRLRAKT